MSHEILVRNTLKRRLASGTPALGCFILTRSADNAEILAHAGLDFLIIDHEHGAGDIGDAIAQIRSMKGTSTSSIIRIPSSDPSHIQSALDAGAEGILCPMIESRAAANAFVKACSYPPHGHRGAGGGIRASNYGRDATYTARIRDELLLAVQIESTTGVENAAEIAAVPGVDLLVIGPRDLSASAGKPGGFEDPDFRGLIARAQAAILASGKFLGSVIFPGHTRAEMEKMGYTMLIAGSDVGLLVEGVRRMVV